MRANSMCISCLLSKQENLHLAERYWKNEDRDLGQASICEILADGCITVVEIVKEINANV